MSLLPAGPSWAQSFPLSQPAPATAPEQSLPPSAQQEALFQGMLRDPTNHELTFAFVAVATANGDLEAAIGALERLLFFEPGLTRARYELGVLYQRLGSYEMAAQYYRTALENPNVDAATRNRIETVLPTVDKMRSASRLSGFLQAGGRYDTNAGYVPNSGLVRLGGLDFPIPRTLARKADWSVFGTAIISHDYDLQNQRGDLIETRAVAHARHYGRLDFLDLGLFEASFGPRLALAPDALPGVTFKPYAVGGGAWFRDGERLNSGGFGVLLGIPVGSRLTIEPGVEWRRLGYRDSPAPRFASIDSGDSIGTFVAARLAVFSGLILDARASYRRIDTTFGFQSSDQIGAEASLTVEFDPPFEQIARRWTFAPYVRVLHTEFEAPNPFIDPTVKRRDTDWRTGAMLEMPITAQFAAALTVEYARTSSTLPNYRTDNFSVLFGPTARF